MSNVRKEPEVVVFEDPRKRKKPEKRDKLASKPEKSKPEEEDDRTVDFKRARYEVLKLGMSNLDKEKYQDAKIAFAVSLGAKPPKRKYMNYKELMEDIKAKKKEKEAQKHQLMTSLMKTPKNKSRKRDKNAVKGFDYQIGHYKDGVQVIPKKEIAASKKKTKRRRK